MARPSPDICRSRDRQATRKQSVKSSNDPNEFYFVSVTQIDQVKSLN